MLNRLPRDRAVIWITSTALGGRRVLRVTMMSPRTTSADRERVLNELESMGGRLLRAQ